MSSPSTPLTSSADEPFSLDPEDVRAACASPTVVRASPSPTPPPAATTPLSQHSAAPIPVKVVEAINSCRGRHPFDEATLAQNLAAIEALIASQQAGVRFYLHTKVNGIFRSVLGTKDHPYLLMTRSTKGGDCSLGKGGTKKVNYCIDLRTGERKVVAVFRYTKPYHKAHAQREIAMMDRLRGVKEVVQLEFSHETDTCAFLVMEECSEGNLADKRKKGLQTNEALSIAVDVMKSVEQLHAKGIVHRDLKPENILLTREGGVLRAKLADLGTACLESDDASLKEAQGTIQWFSREQAARILPDASKAPLPVLRREHDTDALGYLLFMLLHPEHKYMAHTDLRSPKDALEAIAKLADPRHLNEQLKELDEPFRHLLAWLFIEKWTLERLRILLEYAS